MDVCYDERQDSYRIASREFCADTLAPIVENQFDFRSPLGRDDAQTIANSLGRGDSAT
jgi:hypothetical protein